MAQAKSRERAFYELDKDRRIMTIHLTFKIAQEDQSDVVRKLLEFDPVETVLIDHRGRKILVERGMAFNPKLAFQGVFEILLTLFTNEHSQMQFRPLNFLKTFPFCLWWRWYRSYRSQYS